jgi:hypothetical protein
MALDATVLVANLIFAGMLLAGSTLIVVLSRARSGEGT